MEISDFQLFLIALYGLFILFSVLLGGLDKSVELQIEKKLTHRDKNASVMSPGHKRRPSFHKKLKTAETPGNEDSPNFFTPSHVSNHDNKFSWYRVHSLR